jgi:hypothetical protein
MRLGRRGAGWRGDDAGSEWRIGSLIHNVFFRRFFRRGAGEVGLASAVVSLSATLILSPFRAAPMAAVGGAQLPGPSGGPTGKAAISLSGGSSGNK